MNRLMTLPVVCVVAMCFGCQSPPDNMPAPNAQVGKYQAGGGVANSSYNEYPRRYGASADRAGAASRP